jgi:hypothetical protein
VDSSGRAEADVPILLRGAVSGRGHPKGPGRLVEGGAGCKGVPRRLRGRGLGLGGDRAGQGVRGWGPGREWGDPPGRGSGSSSSAPAHLARG